MKVFSKIRRLESELAHDRRELQSTLSEADLQSFNEKVADSTEKHFMSAKKTQMAKFQRLINTTHHSSSPFPQSSSTNHQSSSEKWLVNLSIVQIPGDVQDVLKLGGKFSIPIPNKRIPMEDLISSVESSIFRFDDPIKIEIRNKFTNILTNFKNSPNKLTCSEVNFSRLHKNAVLFLKANPSLLILTADKGNVTVIMDRDEYNRKVHSLLTDTNTYKIQKKDPTLTIQRKTNAFLTKIEKQELIEKPN
jgi:hypothetical protein